MEVPNNKLELEALKRKERLQCLKRKADTGKSEEHSINNPNSESKPIFRSYKPQYDTNPLSDADKITDIESEVKTQLEMMKTPIVIEEIDIANLAPRKPDWDLKRDVSKKLDKLERRTQKAIAELIRERLKMGQEDLLQAVNIATTFTSNVANKEVDD